MTSDYELLEAWRGGDRKAGGVLFSRHFESIRRFFVNKVDTEAAELVQRTFLACVEAKTRFAGRASFRTFLFGIAHNVLREHYRARRRHKDRHHPEAIEDASVVDMGAGHNTALEVKREQRVLAEALRRIPLKYQIVLELYFWEDLTGAQIGEILEMPEDTARSRIRRGKELLKKAVERVGKSEALVRSTQQDMDRWAREVRAAGGG